MGERKQDKRGDTSAETREIARDSQGHRGFRGPQWPPGERGLYEPPTGNDPESAASVHSGPRLSCRSASSSGGFRAQQMGAQGDAGLRQDKSKSFSAQAPDPAAIPSNGSPGCRSRLIHSQSQPSGGELSPTSVRRGVVLSPERQPRTCGSAPRGVAVAAARPHAGGPGSGVHGTPAARGSAWGRLPRPGCPVALGRPDQAGSR